jgi:hypothetical protein
LGAMIKALLRDDEATVKVAALRGIELALEM